MNYDNYHYLEDRIFNKERQIMCAEKDYMNIQNKSNHFSKVLSIFVFLVSFFLMVQGHYMLLLKFGLPSLLITPASIMVLAFLTSVGAKIGEKIYAGKIDDCEEKIQKLKDEQNKYENQLKKVRARQENKKVEKKASSLSEETFQITDDELIQPKTDKPKTLIKSARKRY